MKVNCLTEIYVERALARAAEVDAYLKSAGKVMGPLHGLPISLKDQFPQKGLETTMGKSTFPHVVHIVILLQATYRGSANMQKRTLR